MTGALWSVKEDDQELVLASDENIPLVTTWKTGTNGVNRIYLIAPDLPLASAAGLSIVGKIVEKAGLQTFAAPLDDWQLRSHPVPGGSALVAWNIGKLTEQDRTNFYQRVAAPASATVRGEPSTEYDIESVFDNKIWKQTSNAQGELVLKVAHSPDILYFGKESPAFHKSMAEAAKAYDAVRNKTRDAK